MATRRELITAAAALGFAPPALAKGPPSLQDIAARKGMHFGSCVAWAPPGADAGSFANPRYAALLERDCGILVPENELKWQRTRPAPDRFDFTRFDAILGYAERHGMLMRGHTLLWHKTQFFPGWLNGYDFGANARGEAERLLTNHIQTICRRYGRRIVSYDVVNETIDERTGTPRETSLSKAFGDHDAMVDLAFRTARAEAPHAQLVYNDYMSWEGGENDRHRAGVLRLLEGFRKRGVPVDALGLQSHIGVGGGDVAAQVRRQEGPWRAFLDAVTGMGYKLVITEFDVNDRQLPTDAKLRDRLVADYAGAYLDLCLSYPQLRDVLVWGMCDKYGWLNGFTPRDDKTYQRATPYDADMRVKPLHGAMAKALASAPARA